MKRILFPVFLLAGLAITFTIDAYALEPAVIVRADKVVEHIDTQDSPCADGNGGQQAGAGFKHMFMCPRALSNSELQEMAK